MLLAIGSCLKSKQIKTLSITMYDFVQFPLQVLLEKTVPMLTSIIEGPVDKVPQALVPVNTIDILTICTHRDNNKGS